MRLTGLLSMYVPPYTAARAAHQSARPLRPSRVRPRVRSPLPPLPPLPPLLSALSHQLPCEAAWRVIGPASTLTGGEAGEGLRQFSEAVERVQVGRLAVPVRAQTKVVDERTDGFTPNMARIQRIGQRTQSPPSLLEKLYK